MRITIFPTIFSIVYCVLILEISGAITQDTIPFAEVQIPTYRVSLADNEMDLFLIATRAGIQRDGDGGGRVKFETNLVKHHDQVMNVVSTKDRVVLDALRVWVSVHAKDLQANLSPNDSLDVRETAGSLIEKFGAAASNPIYQKLQRVGTLELRNGQPVLKSKAATYSLRGLATDSVKSGWIGNEMVVIGLIREVGVFDVIRIFEKPANALEVFVISQCPYAKQAELAIISRLNSMPRESRPDLAVRYIFYKRADLPNKFTCLHGEEEVLENLVQIVIRDRYPDYFHEYLLARAVTKEAWPAVAEAVGIGTGEIDEIQARIGSDRRILIETEYDYATTKYAIYDGSPTFVWEGQKVDDITGIELFAGLEFEPGERCGSTDQ